MKAKYSIRLLFLGLTIFGLLMAGQLIFSIPAVKTAASQITPVRYDPFTELYFTDNSSLPKVIRPGTTYRFSFTLHNLESESVDYTFAVYQKTGI